MLTRLHVQGFKSLLDVEMDLAPLVVLMGPNAAGKRNLLEALLLLSRLATEQTLAAAFEPPLRGYPLEAFSLPQRGLEGLLQQEKAELVLEAKVQPTRVPRRPSPEPLPRRIEVIADLLASMAEQGRSQVVVTTHSPTLIAAMIRRAREAPRRIKIFGCAQRGRSTEVREFQTPGPVWTTRRSGPP